MSKIDGSKSSQPDTKEPEVQKVEVKKTFRTLFFSEGFWCKELEQSFTIGYYTPKNEKENNALQKYAGKEVNNLKPVNMK